MPSRSRSSVEEARQGRLETRTPRRSARERLTVAAFELFEERGFEATTVDDVAERAGVGRTTFFRSFRSKEDVIFPDHEAMLGQIRDRLAAASPPPDVATARTAVVEAARLVLRHYLAEGDLARARYRLTSTVPALRAREIAGQQAYQRLFGRYLHGWLGGGPEAALRAELLAAAVVTAHNHVLRRWLRADPADPVDPAGKDPEAAFEAAMAEVITLVSLADPSPHRDHQHHAHQPHHPTTGPARRDAAQRAAVVVVRTEASDAEIRAALAILSR
jgi:AcrR family transcriptional regulator